LLLPEAFSELKIHQNAFRPGFKFARTPLGQELPRLHIRLGS